jgi:hypothetical protein
MHPIAILTVRVWVVFAYLDLRNERKKARSNVRA